MASDVRRLELAVKRLANIKSRPLLAQQEGREAGQVCCWLWRSIEGNFTLTCNVTSITPLKQTMKSTVHGVYSSHCACIYLITISQKASLPGWKWRCLEKEGNAVEDCIQAREEVQYVAVRVMTFEMLDLHQACKWAVLENTSLNKVCKQLKVKYKCQKKGQIKNVI